MNILWLLLQESWLSVAIAIVTGLVSGACSAQLIVLTNTVISANSTENLVWYFAGLAAIALLTGIISQFLLIDLAQSAVYKLRIRLSREILAAPLRQLEELGANRLLASLTEDVQAISNSVFVIPFICIDVAVVIGCLAYLGGLSGIVFLAVLVFVGLAIAFIQVLINKIYKLLTLARLESDTLYKHFRSITEGIKELKLHSSRREEFFTGELEVSAGKLKQIRTKAFQTSAIATVGGELIFFILLGMLLFGLPQVVPVTKPVLGAYILTLTYLVKPLQSILERLPNLFSASVAVQKVKLMGLELARQAEVNSSFNSSKAGEKNSWQKLHLNHITHSYRGEDNHFTLGELNLTFTAGELVFIIGGNGSGKSTLAKIITGLYIPELGTIEIDGIVITDQNREWYRQHFSVIFADFYLFDRLLGIDNIDLDLQAQKYLTALELGAKVQVSDGKFSTTSLSQGQRKRLALLTAYLEDRPIYLFDEWASDQDPLFRDIFYRQLLPDLKSRGKTVLVISHDDRYFEVADRVIKLDYGKIEYDKLTKI
jgi:putative pyoverdin transport system ATP-binding/permease protein